MNFHLHLHQDKICVEDLTFLIIKNIELNDLKEILESL